MLAIFGLIGVLNGFFLSFYLLFFQSKKSRADKYLALLILSLCIRMGKSILFQIAPINFFIINIGLAAFTCVGPFLLFYQKISFSPNFKLRRIDILHFIPAFIILICTFTPFPEEHPVWNVRYDLIMIQILVYIALSFKFYKNNILASEDFSRIRNWYLFLNIAVSLIWTAYGITWWLGILPYLSGTFLFCFVMYIMLFIWLNKEKIGLPEKTEKYKNSIISKEESALYLEKLIKLMKDRKPYLDNDITLAKLAAMQEIPAHILSQVINENLNLNFFEFINSYRIEEVKSRLASPEMSNFTIASIAYDCGFNSISTFNTAFKKSQNQSPSKYRSKYFPSKI
jgi:AraC-like DNA-binding protein